MITRIFSQVRLVNSFNAAYMYDQPSLPAFTAETSLCPVAWNGDGSFEAAVGDLELIITPTLVDERVPPDSTDDEFIIRDQHLEVFSTDAGKVELYDPTIRSSVNIRGGLP